jgi:hypothetical protein
MKKGQATALILTALIASALGAQVAAASRGKSFVAKKGTVSIDFNGNVVASFQQLGIMFNTGSGMPVPASAAYPALSIAPAASQPSRAPRTPLNTVKPTGIVYIGTPAVDFYQQLPTANTQGGIGFPEVSLGSHPALEGTLSYTHTGSNEVATNTLTPLFLLSTSHVKPVVRGNTLTLKNIPMTLAPSAVPFLSLFGPGFTAGQPIGTLTIKATR